MQNNESSIWWCETFILALRRDDEASRHQHQPSNQPCYRPGEVRKCTDYSGVEEKEATSLFHKLAHSNFSTSWGARKTVLINMMLILFLLSVASANDAKIAFLYMDVKRQSLISDMNHNA